MSELDFDLMRNLMNGIENSKSWNDMLMNDPAIKATDKEFYDALHALCELVNEDMIDRIDEACVAYTAAVSSASVLYGIRTIGTIFGCADSIGAVMRYELNRAKEEIA